MLKNLSFNLIFLHLSPFYYLKNRVDKKIPKDNVILRDSLFLKEGGLLLSHIALQYHRRRRA